MDHATIRRAVRAGRAALCLLLLAPLAAAQKAGEVAAQLPAATIQRGSSAALDAAKGAEVQWNDLLRTDKQGRVRVALLDQSVISLGANSELRILPRDAQGRTLLRMAYGLIRMQVVKLTKGQRMELRTPTAVAGVIGSDFGADVSVPGQTKFICIAGEVQISSADPNVSGTVVCRGGQTVTVKAGEPLPQPERATPQQLEHWQRVTDPAFPHEAH